MVSGVVLAGSAVKSGFGVVVLIVIASWALLFAVLFGMLIYVTVLRGRRLRRKRVAPGPAVSADPNLPAVLAQARHADPYFDEQLLLDASQLICLVIFAAISTGDEEAIRYLAARRSGQRFLAVTPGIPHGTPGCSGYKSGARGPARAAGRGFRWTTRPWPPS